MKQILPANKGVDAVVYFNNTPLAGQKNATINRRMNPINVTNKINGDWSTSLAGTKSWTLICDGMFIKDKESFDTLESVFSNGLSVNVEISDGDRKYTGRALVTSFPVAIKYNDTYAYNITLTGTGELVYENVNTEG